VTPLFLRTGIVAVATAATSLDVAAQVSVCHTVKPGDTASAVAWRLTGRLDARHQPWFRVVDRTRPAVIPKAAYDRILVGWQVCIPEARFNPMAAGTAPTDAIRRGDAATLPAVLQSMVATGPLIGARSTENGVLLVLTLVFLGPILVGAVVGFGWHRTERFLANRRSLKREAEDFGDLFVRHFEWPLTIDGVASRPIRTRMRWAWRQRRLDIFLAPAAGRRYPNLDDHRRNVEYDVDRIAYRLRHHRFERRPLRSDGQWVVVPFQLTSHPQTGDWI